MLHHPVPEPTLPSQVERPSCHWADQKPPLFSLQATSDRHSIRKDKLPHRYKGWAVSQQKKRSRHVSEELRKRESWLEKLGPVSSCGKFYLFERVLTNIG